MRYSCSNTAEYGDYTAGPRIVTNETRTTMTKLLAEIQNGIFVRNFIEENMAGGMKFDEIRRRQAKHSDAEHRLHTVG